MKPKTRTVKSPDQRRSELLATAQQLFFTKGYSATSVSDITKSMNVAKGTFYYYFDSKMELLEALVDDFTEQAMAVMSPIVEDETLKAAVKWQAVFHTGAAWKTEHRDELLVVLRAMNSPGNVLLWHKRRARALETTAPMIGRIIQQGITEGVFSTEYVEESAEIALAIMQSVNDIFTDLVLHPEKYDDRLSIARRKLGAIQDAVERVIGATPDSLPIVDELILQAWFGNA